MSENQDQNQVLSGQEIASRLVAKCVYEQYQDLLDSLGDQPLIYVGPVDAGYSLFLKCTITKGAGSDMVAEVDAQFEGVKVLEASIEKASNTIDVKVYVPGEWEKLVP